MTLSHALAALYRAGRIRSPWLPGMLVIGWRGEGPQRVLDGHLNPAGPAWRLDLTDPATVGCLLALLREAAGDPGISAAEQGEGAPSWSIVKWDPEWGTVDALGGSPHRGDTEGQALSAALVALAQKVTP